VRDARRLSPLDGAVIGVVAAALVLLVVIAVVARSRDVQPGTATSSTTSTATTAARFDRVTPTFAPPGSSDTTTATDVPLVATDRLRGQRGGGTLHTPSMTFPLATPTETL
jgi:hypothetical protein